MYQLEDRILFDGAAVVDVTAAAQQQANETQQQAETQNADKEQSQSTEHAQDSSSGAAGTAAAGSSDSLSALLSGDHQVAELAASALPDWSSGAGKTNVLVVSDAIWNTEGLLSGVKEGTIVVHFDPAKTTGAELLQMIKDALGGKSADSIGILSGAAKDGQFSLIADGKTSLGSLGDDAQQQFWSGLGQLLDQDGRIDLFASKLAGNETGRDLVAGLAGLAGHRINASSDVTGDIDAGGDWDLEYSSADRTADHTAADLIADYFDTSALSGYDHLLSGAKEIAFINPTVLGRESIVAGLGPDVEVVFLPRENAFEFMTDYLKDCSGVDAIHLFTHGEDGQFILGWTDGVNSDFINSHRDDFAVWGDAMSRTGDIMIYGCNIAADADGEHFIDLLGEATGRDVAASSDRVGYGGDWIMEYSAGRIETHGYVFNNYFYSLAQWTVKNNADDPIASAEAVNRSNLSLREAIFVAQDGDLIVFDNQANLEKNYRTTGIFKTIMLYDTLVIDKNITIDGLISMTAPTPTYTQAVINGIDASRTVLKYGTDISVDTITRNGIQMTADLKSLQIGSGNWTWDKYEYVNGDNVTGQGTWLADVVLNTAVAIREDFDVKRDMALTGNATLANGTTFNGDLVLQLDTASGATTSTINFSWSLICDISVSGEMTLAGGSNYSIYEAGGWVNYTGTRLGAGGATLTAGSVIAKGSKVYGTVNGISYNGQQLGADLTVGANSTATLNVGSILANGTILDDGSAIRASAASEVILGIGTTMGNGTTLKTGGLTSVTTESFMVANGFSLKAGMRLTAGTILPKGAVLYKAGDLNESVTGVTAQYIYSGSVVNQADSTIDSGTKLLGDLSMSVRTMTVDSVAENITGAVISDTTTTTTTTSLPYTTGNPSNKPAGTTTTVAPTVVTTKVTTTTDDFSNTTTTTTTTSVTVTTVEVVTAATETAASTITTTTSTQTVVENKVVRNGLLGVTLQNLKVVNGESQVRPDVVGSSVGEIIGEGHGGGIYVVGQSSLTLRDVFVGFNHADMNGGGIWSSGILDISTGGTTGSGTFVQWDNGVSFNWAGNWSWSSGKLTILHSGNGGGIYNSGVLRLSAESFNVTRHLPGGILSILGNMAAGDGGGIYSATGRVVADSMQLGSPYTEDAPGFHMPDDPNTPFTAYGGNQALNGNGGGIYIDGKGSQMDTVTFYRVDFEGNEALMNGGGLYFTRGNLTTADTLSLEWCDIYYNKAGLSGGGIYVTGSTGAISIKTVIRTNSGVNIQSEIFYNEAGVSGGGIAVVDNQGTVTLDFIKMSNNTAGSYGGALYVANSQNVLLTDMEVSNNSAGGWYFDQSNFLTRVTDLSRIGSGGAIYYTNLSSSFMLSIATSNISENSINCLVNVDDSLQGKGGGIYLDQGILSIVSSTLAQNGYFSRTTSSYALGGAIYMRAGSLTVNFSTIAYNYGKGAAIYIAGDDKLLATLTVTNSIIYNSTTYVDENTHLVLPDPMTTSANFSQIYLSGPNQAGTGKFINVNFSTSTNIYSHYFKDMALWSMSVRSDGRSNNALALTTATTANGSGWINSHKVIASTYAESVAIEKNLYLDTDLNYHANYRTRSIAIVSQLSWAYNVISAAGVKYDQRGNLRVDGKAWTWDSTKYKWVQGAKTRASVGAFEAIFYLEVNSKADDSKIMYSHDQNGIYIDAAYGGSGLTLREATYWVDTRDALLQLALHSLVSASASIDGSQDRSDYVTIANNLITNYNRFYTGVLLLKEDATGYRTLASTGEVPEGYSIITDHLAGFNNDLTLNEINIAGSANNPSAFGYITDYQGNVVMLNGVPQRISTTGTIGFDKTVFAAGQDNTISLTNGSIYTSRIWWRAGNAAKDFVIGDMFGLSYRAQNASDRITVDGVNEDRIFVFGRSQNVVINNLTFTRGNVDDFDNNSSGSFYAPLGQQNNGGAIWSDGVLVLNNVRLTGNNAENVASASGPLHSGYGGALFNSTHGRVYLFDTTVDSNTATGNGNSIYNPTKAAVGGGIYNRGYMMIERSNISGNLTRWQTSTDTSGGSYGGGLFNEAGATLYIANTTISINTANSQSTGGNGYNGLGGAIFNSGTLYSYGNTIFGNTSIIKTAANVFPGINVAALYNNTGSSLYIANSIVAENIGIGYAGSEQYSFRRDIYVASASVVQTSGTYNARYNVIGAYNNSAMGGFDWDQLMVGAVNSDGTPILDGGGNQVMIPANIVGRQPTDATGQNVNIFATTYGYVDNLRLEKTMDYNGAKTMNYRVLGGSVALNSGIFTLAYRDELYDLGFRSIETDQRGVFRTTDGNGNATELTNMGSFETISLLVVGTGSDSLNSRSGFDFVNNLPLWESPALTLREALYLADDGTSIVFKSGWQVNGTKSANGTVVTNELNSSGNLVITLQGALTVNRDVTIDGSFLPAGEAGKVVPNTVSIQMAGNVADRIFYIKNDEANRVETVALYNLQLSGGRANGVGTAAASSGGAIFAVANLTLGNVSISSSQAGNGGYGGGVYLEGGVLTMNDVTVQNCTALYGGGVYIKGSNLGQVQLHANNVSLIGNTARSINGLAGTGGGLYVESGNAILKYVTIGNNKSGAEGGGIYVLSGAMDIYNSTIANNTSGFAGGGIYFSGSSGESLVMDFTTVANNQSSWTIAGSAVSGAVGRGGGIYLAGGKFFATNSVIAQNFRGAYNLSTGTHDDLSVNNRSIWNNGVQANNLFGTVTDNNGIEFTLPGGGVPTDANNNYFLNAQAGGIDWRYFAGLVDGYSQLLDSSLGWNGGKQMTIYVNSGKNLDRYFFRSAAGAEGFDQTQLEYFADNTESTANRRTVGAFEKQARTVYYVQGELKGNNLTASSWISANGVFLLERDGVLDAPDTEFVFVSGHDVLVNPIYGNRLINQLVTKTVTSSTGGVIYYTAYYGKGRDQELVTDYQAMTAEEAAAAHVKNILTVTSGTGTLVGNWTLFQSMMHNSNADRSIIVIGNTDAGSAIGSLRIAEDVVLNGRVRLETLGTLDLSTTNYSKMGILLNSLSTTVVYSSAKSAQTVLVQDYEGNQLAYSTLKLTDGGTGKASSKTYAGVEQLTVGNLWVGKTVTFKVNAVPNQNGGDLLITSSVIGDGNPSGRGLVWTAGSLILGEKIYGTSVTVMGVQLDANRGGQLMLQATTIELAGYAILGSGATDIYYRGDKINVNGFGNQVMTNVAPSFGNTSIVISGDAELAFNFGSANIELNKSIYSQISLENSNSRLEFRTTGTLTQMVFDSDALSKITGGTLALYGTITVDAPFLMPFRSALEIGGNVTLATDINYGHDITLNGNIKLGNISGTTVTIASTTGKVVLGGTLNAATGKYISGNQLFNGGGKTLEVVAATEAYIGGLNGFKDVNVTGANGIFLGGPVTATGNITLANSAKVLDVYDAKGSLLVIKLAAGGVITANGFSSDAGVPTGQLQLQASTLATNISNLGSFDLYGSVNFLQGNFTTGSINAGALVSKATTLTVGGAIAIVRNSSTTGELTVSSGTLTASNVEVTGGIFTNSGTVTADALTIVGYLNYDDPTNLIRWAGGLNNLGTMTVAGLITMNDGLKIDVDSLGTVIVIDRLASTLTNSRTLSAGGVDLNDSGILQNNGGVFTITGDLEIGFGSVTNKAQLLIGGDLLSTETNYSGGPVINNSSILTVSGSLSLTGLNSSLNNTGGTLSAHSIEIEGNLVNRAVLKATDIVISTGSLENRGTMKDADNSTSQNPLWINSILLKNNASITNYGTLTAISIASHREVVGLVYTDSAGSVTNASGTLTVMDMTLYGTLTNNGTLLLGGTLSLNEGHTNVSGLDVRLTVGTLVNAGTIGGVQFKSVDNGTTIVDAYLSYGRIIVTGDGTIDNNSGRSLKASAIQLDDGSLYNLGTLNLLPTYTFTTDKATKAKTLTSFVGAGFDGSLTILGKGAVNNSGTMTVGSINLNNLGQATGDIANNGSITAGATFVKWTSAGVNYQEMLTDGAVELNGNFINNAGKSFRSTSLIVNGIFDAGTGLLLSGGGITNRGTLTVTAASSTVTNSNVQTSLYAGLDTNAKGIGIQVYAGVENLSGSLTAGSLWAKTGTINNQAAITLSALSVLNNNNGVSTCTVLADGSLTIGGDSNVPDAVYGSLVNAKGKTIRAGSITINTIGAKQPDGTITGSLANEGSITVTASGVVYVGERVNNVSGQFATTLSTGVITVGNGGDGVIVNGSAGSISAAGINLNSTGDFANDGTVTARAVYVTIQKYNSSTGKTEPTVVVWGDNQSTQAIESNGGIVLAGGNLINNRSLTAGSLRLIDSGLIGGVSANLTNVGTLTVTSVVVRTGTVNNLVSDGCLTLEGNGSLVNGKIDASVNKVTSGTINVSGLLVDAATVTGRISVGGRANNTSGTITATGISVNGGDLVNGGSYTNTSNANVLTTGNLIINTVSGQNGSGQLYVAGSFDSKSGAVTLNSQAQTADSGSAVIVGDFKSNGAMTLGGSLAVGGSLTNSVQRTISIRGPVFSVGGNLVNNGTINATAADAVVTWEVLNNGTMTVKSLEVKGTGLTNKGSLTMTGSLILNGLDTALENASGKTIRTGDISVDGSITNFGTISSTGAVAAYGQLTNSGTFTVAQNLIANSLENATGKTLSAKAISVIAGELNNGGTLTAAGDLSVTGAFNNAGTANITGNVSALSLSNVTGKMITIRGTSVNITDGIRNLGTFSAAAADVEFGGDLENSGVFTAKSITAIGDIVNLKTITLTGDLSAASFKNNASASNLTVGSVSVLGVLDNYGQLNAKGSVSAGGHINTYTGAGAFNVGGNLSAESIEHESGNFAVRGSSVTVTGYFHAKSGFTASAAQVTLSGNLVNSSTFTVANLTVTGSIENTQKLQISNTLTVVDGSGSITNELTGVVTVGSIFNQNSNMLYNNGSVTAKTITYTGTPTYGDGSHYQGNLPKGTLQHVPSPVGNAYAMLESAGASYNSLFDDEAGQTLDAFLAY